MAPAAVQELVGDQGIQRQVRRHQPQLEGAHAADPLLLDGTALLRPLVALGYRPDQVTIVLQVLVIIPVKQQGNRLPALFILLPQGLEFLKLQHTLLVAFEADFPLQVVFVGGGFQCQQVAIEVLLDGCVQLAVVCSLIEQEHHDTGHHQARGYPGWAFPVDGVLGGDNQHGRSQFIIICP